MCRKITGFAEAFVFARGFSWCSLPKLSRIGSLVNIFFVSLTPVERASATGLSLHGRCSNRSMNSCISSCHLHSRFEDSVMLAQLVSVVFSVRTITHRPAKSSGYQRRAETAANSSRSFAGHFCSAGESVFESQANGISLLLWVTRFFSG